MNILYISYDGLTDALGQSQILPYLTGCSRQHEITILSVEKPASWKQRHQQIKKITDQHHIRWKPIFYTKNPPLISTIYDVLRMIRLARNIINQESIDIVHVRSYIAAFVAMKLHGNKRLKWVFDMRGFWADERMDGGIWSRSNLIHSWLYKWLKTLEKQWFQKSDHIVSLTLAGKSEILQHIQPTISPEKISIIPCCVDDKTFQPATITFATIAQNREKLGIRAEDKVLCYLGSIGTWYLAEEMMDCFVKLKNNQLVNRFLWITNESGEHIQQLAKSKELHSNEVCVIRGERSEIPALIATIDLGIFYIKDAYSKKASSPTKLGEFLVMGKPVICNPIGDLKEQFKHNDFGVCHSLDQDPDPELIRKAFNLNPETIRLEAQKIYGLDLGIQSYLNIYNKLHGNT